MKKKNLNSKIAKYSMLAGAALLTLSACKKDKDENDSNIEDNDIPDLSLTATTNSSDEYLLDVNGDGINDLSFTVENYTYTYDNTNYNYASIDAENGANLLTAIENVSYGGYSYDLNVAKVLSEGNSISSSSTIWDDYGILGVKGTYYGIPQSVGQFLSQDKYVGFKFPISGSMHYGWVRVSVNANASSVVIKEYAYHKTPETAIEAGAK